MQKKNKLALKNLKIQSFVTSMDPSEQHKVGGNVVQIETNNNPNCWSPLCMTVPTPCTEGGPPCVAETVIGVKDYDRH